MVIGVAVAGAALLAACGQKGPLYLESTTTRVGVRPVEHMASAPDDMMPHGPAIPPTPAPSTPGTPSPVGPNR